MTPQYSVLVRSYEGAPWNVNTKTNLRPTLEEAKALWQELAAICGVSHVKILDPLGNEVTGDTRPDPRVVGHLTARLYAAVDREDVSRAHAEDAAEYLLNTNATYRAMFDRLVHEIVAQTKEATLFTRMEASCLLAIKQYVDHTAITEAVLHDLRQICLRTVVDMLPSGTPMPEVTLGVQDHSPGQVVLSVRRK